MSDLQELKQLKKETLCRDILTKTEKCGFVWSQISRTQYKARNNETINNWTFIVGKSGAIEDLYTLDVLLNEKYFISINSIEVAIIEELYYTVSDIRMSKVKTINRVSNYLNTLLICRVNELSAYLKSNSSLTSSGISFFDALGEVNLSAIATLTSNETLIAIPRVFAESIMEVESTMSATGTYISLIPDSIYVQISKAITNQIIYQKIINLQTTVFGDMFYPLTENLTLRYAKNYGNPDFFFGIENTWVYENSTEIGWHQPVTSVPLPTVDATFQFGVTTNTDNLLNLHLTSSIPSLSVGTNSAIHVIAPIDPNPSGEDHYAYDYSDPDNWRAYINKNGYGNGLTGDVAAYTLGPLFASNTGYVSYSPELLVGCYIKINMKAIWVVQGTPPADTAKFTVSLPGNSDHGANDPSTPVIFSVPIVQNSNPFSVSINDYADVSAIIQIKKRLDRLFIAPSDQDNVFGHITIEPPPYPSLCFTIKSFDILELEA